MNVKWNFKRDVDPYPGQFAWKDVAIKRLFEDFEYNNIQYSYPWN